MKKYKLICLVLMISLSILLAGCSKAQEKTDKEITVSAAASLTDALDEIGEKYEENTGTKISFNFAGSGTLRQQIEQGAPVDLFISASQKQMDQLEEKDMIEKETRTDILKNRLVLVVSREMADRISSIDDLAQKNMSLSIGTVDVVPAGDYAKEVLSSLGLWDKMKGDIVYAKHVRQVFSYVESNETSAGIVYKSDAALSKNSVMKQVFAEDTHTPILYPAAIVSDCKNSQNAKNFLDYLKTEDAKEVFQKYGFETASN